jgi:hypothetical protein
LDVSSMWHPAEKSNDFLLCRATTDTSPGVAEGLTASRVALTLGHGS